MPLEDKWRTYRVEWNRAHRDEINARRRAAYAANPEPHRKAALARVSHAYHNNPDVKARAKANSRARSLWICYRLTPEEYDVIFAFQGGVCAGCGEPPGRVRLAVDHCHKTGLIRGLLCWLCNRAIGILRDNAEAATNLGGYLDWPTAPEALGKETYGLIGKAMASKKVKVYGPPKPVTKKKGIRIGK